MVAGLVSGLDHQLEELGYSVIVSHSAVLLYFKDECICSWPAPVKMKIVNGAAILHYAGFAHLLEGKC